MFDFRPKSDVIDLVSPIGRSDTLVGQSWFGNQRKAWWILLLLNTTENNSKMCESSVFFFSGCVCCLLLSIFFRKIPVLGKMAKFLKDFAAHF